MAGKGGPTLTCPHGVTPKGDCRQCKRDYDNRRNAEVRRLKVEAVSRIMKKGR